MTFFKVLFHQGDQNQLQYLFKILTQNDKFLNPWKRIKSKTRKITETNFLRERERERKRELSSLYKNNQLITKC